MKQMSYGMKPTILSNMSVDNRTRCSYRLYRRCQTVVPIQNGRQLNPDKSEALVVGTANQLCIADSSASSLSVAGVDLPVAEIMKVLVLNRRLTFHKHVSMVAQSCNYHAQAIRHIRFLSTELAQTLACSLILSRIEYRLLSGTIQKLQRAQNNAARIVLQVSRRSHAKPLLHQVHWLPVQQRITYKLAVMTYKVRSTSTPVYLHRRIAERAYSRTLRSSAIPLLDQPFMRTDFSGRAFRFSASSVWNSLLQTVLISDSLSVLNPDLKLFCSIRLLPNTDPICRQRL